MVQTEQKHTVQTEQKRSYTDHNSAKNLISNKQLVKNFQTC